MIETYVIHITKECNCNCKYCYETDKDSTYTWEEVHTFLKEIEAKATGEYSIEFLGGEPMLRLDLIKKVIENSKASGYVITTNGTIVNRELLDLLLDNKNVQWVASLDGHALANMLRVFKDGTNTYQIVIDNIKGLLAAGFDRQVSVHMTSHHYNAAFIHESIKVLYDEGVRSIGVGIVESTLGIDDRFCKEWLQQMQQVSRSMKRGLFPGLRVHELMQLKPRSDQRTYIKDDTGKMIGETYGRAGEDITSTENYNVEKVDSHLSETICDLREKVFKYHQDHKITWGLGTGRCGSKQLAKYLCADHEYYDFMWVPEDKQFEELRGQENALVQATLLLHVELLLFETDINFLCVERKRDDFVTSFMRAHKLVPTDDWDTMPNKHQYPYFDGNIKDGLEHYWEVYQTTALAYSREWPDRFEYISYESLMRRIDGDSK